MNTEILLGADPNAARWRCLQEVEARHPVVPPAPLQHFASPQLMFLAEVEEPKPKGPGLSKRVLIMSRKNIFVCKKDGQMVHTIPVVALASITTFVEGPKSTTVLFKMVDEQQSNVQLSFAQIDKLMQCIGLIQTIAVAWDGKSILALNSKTKPVTQISGPASDPAKRLDAAVAASITHERSLPPDPRIHEAKRTKQMIELDIFDVKASVRQAEDATSAMRSQLATIRAEMELLKLKSAADYLPIAMGIVREENFAETRLKELEISRVESLEKDNVFLRNELETLKLSAAGLERLREEMYGPDGVLANEGRAMRRELREIKKAEPGFKARRTLALLVTSIAQKILEKSNAETTAMREGDLRRKTTEVVQKTKEANKWKKMLQRGRRGSSTSRKKFTSQKIMPEDES